MAQSKQGAVKPAPLTIEEKENIVEEYLGVHPRYFLYSGNNIKLNTGMHRFDGFHFNGWAPNKKAYHG